jgi:hypothetical protein
MGQASFVDLDLADGTDQSVQGTALRQFEFHADGLQALWAQRQDIFLRGW